MSSIQRERYSGDSVKLVVAFDIGMRFSRVSYSILEPDQPPEIHTVTQCVLLIYFILMFVSD